VEIAMQRPCRRPRRPHRQLDLALALTSLPVTPATPPAWSALPEPTQRTLTGLLTRLLVAHASVVPKLDAQPEGDGDER
jgi:hypothetical protein